MNYIQSRINDYGLHGIIFKIVFLKASFKQTIFVLALEGGNQTKFIKKLSFVILVFPGYDGLLPIGEFFIAHFEKIHALPDILTLFKIGPYFTKY
jgi:hypothetical protein